MKKVVAVLLMVIYLLPFAAMAQLSDPVKWTWKAEPLKAGEYKLVFTARIEPEWHIYSLIPAADGFERTSIRFAKNDKVTLMGNTTERGGKVHEAFDEYLGISLKQFEEEMICEQVIKVSTATKVTGSIEFMACKEVCIPARAIDFEFDLQPGKGVLLVYEEPKVESISRAVATPDNEQDTVSEAVVPPLTTPGNKFGHAAGNCGQWNDTASQGLWSVIVLGFLGGLLALLTPCVFPMIPLTVSFFTKRNESKTKGRYEALFYGFCIVFIYFLLAVPFLLFNISPDTLNEISTGAPLNLFFFIVFLIFAFSFFGFYEIQLPSFIANKADSVSNTGGLVGIFFMALTLAIVSFSCTGPILGSLLVGALSSAGGKLNLVAGMSAFGFALALPFALFALFPGMMAALPKSGGWLNSVKVVLGFVELIFAFKFLSNADMVAHWGILKREVFLGIWAILGAGLFIYLIGKIRFPHDSPVGKLSPVRISAAVLALMFTGYTLYGIAGNDISFFSGFPPPKFYSYIKTKSAIEPIKNNYEAALAKAKAEGKPLMIDFTGWACVSCRRMEEKVWPEYEVLKRLSEEYVIVSLYVDDREPLPASEQYVSDITGKKIRTVGNKFSDMQVRYFHANTQPYYVLVSPDEKLLTTPLGYTADVKEYVSFLDCGLSAYSQLSKQTAFAGTTGQ
jgi:thiol:disulfide interchange protein DsbD